MLDLHKTLALAVACTSLACGGRLATDPVPAQGVARQDVYVGSLEGTDAVVAVVVEGSDVVAYVCGGAKTLATHTRWFTGTRQDDGPIRIETDGWALAGAFDGTRVEGTLAGDHQAPQKWTAQRVRPDTLAGLYAVTDEGCRTGLVVRQDSEEEPSFQGAWCNRAGMHMQVTPLRPYDKRADLIAVSVHVDDQDRHLYVAPFSPSAR